MSIRIINSFIRRSSLIRKLLAGILIIEILMLSILVYNSVRLLNSTHSELFKRTIHEETTLMGSLLVSGLSVRDLAVIHENLQLFARQANVKYAIVYDRHGHIMSEVGQIPSHFKLDKSFSDSLSDGVFDTEYIVQLDGQVFGKLRTGFSVNEIAQLSHKAKLQNTLIAFMEIILTITATIFIGSYLVRRIASLQLGARHLQEGNFDYQIPVKDNDELGELAEAFNKLGASLKESAREIQDKQQEIQQRATHFSRLLNSVNAIIFEASTDPFRILFVNEEALSLMGYLPYDWQIPNFIVNITHPEDKDQMLRFVRDPEDRKNQNFDFRARNIHGQYVWLRQIINIENTDGQNAIHGILIDVTSEKRNAEVERVRDIALAENRTKNLFMANMSHELRTPLNAIIGYTELISEECELETTPNCRQIIDDLDKVARSGRHLLALINEILDISRINAGKFELRLSEFNFSELTRDLYDVIIPLAEKNNNKFTVERQIDFTVFADRKRLYQIMMNLCSNACKFTTNGTINMSIVAAQNPDNYVIKISDTGIGIKSEEIDKLFMEFARTEDVSTVEGTGLGLCLSQKLCVLMGGNITLESEYGKGSTFIVTLPKVVTLAEQDEIYGSPLAHYANRTSS